MVVLLAAASEGLSQALECKSWERGVGCLEVTCEGLAGPCRQLLFEDCLRPQKGGSGGGGGRMARRVGSSCPAGIIQLSDVFVKAEL